MNIINEVTDLIDELEREGYVKWVVILRHFSDMIFIFHLNNDIELQISKQDFNDYTISQIYNNIKEFGGLNENKEKE